ncbi:central tail hub [Stenotrophomonas phage vB_SmaS-AXL_3]|uniref:Central tail hub n=1 Tax=Stenotrophomonas phage vB_SmaS-AXL_3 TaxID=2740427 RepID=A0A7D5BU33_9CAUD|nr:tail protein [Stenotrophomonas phage vB_SmaS-AXL_3]QKW95563.1 central tail hub [Stenotrophomonas phage vB_SmaS-AXL_3]
MWAAIVIIVIALLLVLAAPKPKIENARAANLGDFQFPRSKEGDPVPWFLGTVRLKSPNSLWYGDYTPVPIKKKQKTGLFSSKKVTVGYKYHIGLDLCWCLAGDDTVELLRLWSDKYTFFQGSLTTQSSINVNLPNLFGGEEQRGGLIGTIDFYPGRFNEERNPYLMQVASPDVPAYVGQCRTVFRGSVSTLASGFYFGTTTNVNAISAEMRRISRKVHPTYSVMPNGFDVNPMEFMYAAFTEKFGMPGVSTDNIDLPSWQACAQQLYNEGFGMSLLVQQGVTGKDLAEEALRIADGILYQDDETGKMVARLIRDDYDLEDLPIFDQSVVKELVNFNKTTWEQTYNQCRVTFKDRANEYADKAATAQDFANINFQQRVKNTDISVPGCFVNDEANNLAVRQLSLLSVPLFQIEIRCNRKASLMKPGDVFIFNYAPYGITNMVMRIQRIDKGLLTDGVVTINAVQDRFATALAVFAPPGGSGWVPIQTGALPVTDRLFFETPKWFHQFLETKPAANQAAGYVVAKKPGSASVGYDAEVSANGTYSDVLLAADDNPYSGSFLLATSFTASNGRSGGYSAAGFRIEVVDLPTELVDQNGSYDPTGQFFVLMNGEFMQPTDLVNNGDGTYDFTGVYRALLDTTFQTHAIGSRGYLVKQSDGLLPTFVGDTATLYGRLRDVTPNDTLPVDQALTNSLVMSQRAYRPAPPDYVTVEGSRAPSAVAAGGSVSLSWRARNRNTNTVVAYDAGAEAQEAGVDYGWRSRVGAGSWSALTYVAAPPVSVPVPGSAGIVEYEVFSRRDGVNSWTGDSCFVEATVPLPTDDFAIAVLADNPTWFAKHNEAVDSTVAVNYGTGAAGTYVPKLSNSAAPIFVGGDVCWNNSSSDYCDIPAACLPAGTDEFTLEIMVNEAVLNNYQALIDRDAEGVVRKWQWRLDASGVQNFIQIISGVSTVSGAGASVGATCLLGVRVKTDGECTIWKNGAVVTTGSVPTGLDWGHDTTGLRVLRRIQGDSANTGKCAASIIYDYALSDARMLVHAQEAGLA